jgi:hypothetical protein
MHRFDGTNLPKRRLNHIIFEVAFDDDSAQPTAQLHLRKLEPPF